MTLPNERANAMRQVWNAWKMWRVGDKTAVEAMQWIHDYAMRHYPGPGMAEYLCDLPAALAAQQRNCEILTEELQRASALAESRARGLYIAHLICPTCRGTGWELGGYSHPSGTALLQVCPDCKGTGKYRQT